MIEPSEQLHIRWLTDPVVADDDYVADASIVPERHELPIPPEIGHGWFERIPLAAGVTVFQGVHRFRPEAAGHLVPLAEFKAQYPENIFMVQTVHGGSICHRELSPPEELIYRPGHDFFRHADRIHVIPLVDSTSNNEMTALAVTDTLLVELIGESLAQQLLVALGLEHSPVVKVIPIPLHVSAPLRTCLSPTLTGPLRKLFAQSRVLDYLCALVLHACTPTLPALPSGRKREKIRELHDYLIELEGKLPSLDALSKNYGMSARWLNDEFAREYGLPIFSFVAEHRLSEAHAALTGSQVPIKILAQRMGYSHVNHFSIAFKKKFGYPPSALRKDRAAKDD
ncbi:MAG TPA: AraC family transcriptional regulator [Rhodocyclaceae bacterium]|nr:AraC family transcriptional regulator [Rhodocyclaceae bacterium]